MSNDAASASASSGPQFTFLKAHFVVVGGGVAGLSAAVALGRAGHRVTLLERDADFAQSATFRRGIRMPPNLTKILNHWGMRPVIDTIGIVSGQVVMQRLENAHTLGKHVWNREMLEEAGGEFMFIDHHDLRQALLQTAKSLGADVRTRSEVVGVADDGRSVVLQDGQRVDADVIVGATGRRGLIRGLLSKDHNADDAGKPRGLMMFDATVPSETISADPELRSLVGQEHTTQWAWFGDRHCALAFSLGQTGDFSFYLYAPDDGKTSEERIKTVSSKAIAAHAADFEPRIRKLAAAATGTCVKVVDRGVFEHWVHSSGRLVGIGEAVHPFVPGSIQGPCMSLEDASVLGKLFSHLLEDAQIPSFLYAFEEIRQSRVIKIHQVDSKNIDFMTIPSSSDYARMRDEAMRTKFEAGKNALNEYSDSDSDDGTERAASRWSDNREIFGYDAEDEADNWWVEWGLLRLRAQNAPHHLGSLSGLNGVTVARGKP